MNQRWYKRFRIPPLDQSDYSNFLHHSLTNTYCFGNHPLLYLIYKADIVCVCVFAMHARVSCSVALKLAVAAGGTGVRL